MTDTIARLRELAEHTDQVTPRFWKASFSDDVVLAVLDVIEAAGQLQVFQSNSPGAPSGTVEVQRERFLALQAALKRFEEVAG